MTLALVIGLSQVSAVSGAAGAGTPSASLSSTASFARVSAPVSCPPNSKPVPDGCIPRSAVHVVAGERCKSARLATAHYRALTWERQEARDGELADRTPIVRSKTCRWSRFAAETWVARAKSARRSLERWREERTLRDFTYCEGCHAWRKAVDEVQRVFPGTSSWLLSCSAAEGGHGRWVGYGGVSYSTDLRDSDTVGGNLQFRFSTFVGMYRRGVEYARERRFRVPRMDTTTAWRSALGQAIAGGWARATGNDNSHWSASWGRGCS